MDYIKHPLKHRLTEMVNRNCCIFQTNYARNVLKDKQRVTVQNVNAICVQSAFKG